MTAVKRVSGHGYRPTDSPPTLDTAVGCSTGKSAGVVFSRCGKAGGKRSVLAGPLNEADVFVSASDNNVKSLVEHNWMFRIEARTCKCEWTYL